MKCFIALIANDAANIHQITRYYLRAKVFTGLTAWPIFLTTCWRQ